MSTAIYLDHSATTPMHPEVREAMLPWLGEAWGNPSSLHRHGRAARHAVDTARDQVAALIGADSREIIFTGSGTEANNLAIHGPRLRGARNRIVTTAVEHHAVLHPARRRAEREGLPLDLLPVDAEGRIAPNALDTAIDENAMLVSAMLVNNETGTLQDGATLAAHCQDVGAIFHSDAVQAAGRIPINVRNLPVSLLSISAHKLQGPKGIGALYVRRGLRLDAQVVGGPQESGRRAGTENVAAIVGFGRACALAAARLDDVARRVSSLRDQLEHEVCAAFPAAIVNGHPLHRAPHILNLSFPGHDGESLMLALDAQGIAVSTGSACTAGSLDPSHVLLAMGLDHAHAQAALRFSLGPDNTEDEVRYVVQTLCAILGRV